MTDTVYYVEAYSHDVQTGKSTYSVFEFPRAIAERLSRLRQDIESSKLSLMMRGATPQRHSRYAYTPARNDSDSLLNRWDMNVSEGAIKEYHRLFAGRATPTGYFTVPGEPYACGSIIEKGQVRLEMPATTKSRSRS